MGSIRVHQERKWDLRSLLLIGNSIEGSDPAEIMSLKFAAGIGVVNVKSLSVAFSGRSVSGVET
jgi:hypothetical protein